MIGKIRAGNRVVDTIWFFTNELTLKYGKDVNKNLNYITVQLDDFKYFYIHLKNSSIIKEWL